MKDTPQIFIKGLPYSWGNEDLLNWISPFVPSKVQINKQIITGLPSGSATVSFKCLADAEKFIQKKSDALIENRKVTITKSTNF